MHKKIDSFTAENEKIIDRGLMSKSSTNDVKEKLRAITSPPPTSCVDLSQLGNQISGFYLVKDNQEGKKIQTIFFDFKLLSSDPSNSTLTFHFKHFYALFLVYCRLRNENLSKRRQDFVIRCFLLRLPKRKLFDMQLA